jgi:MFS transporter, DHA1 family, multidrug resistance protein
VGQIISSFLQKPFGKLADRYNKVHQTAIGGVISATGLLLFMVSTNAYNAFLAQLVFSIGGAVSMPSLSAIVAIEGRSIGLGTTMSVLEGAMSLGMIVGPLISGLIIDLIELKMIFLFSSIMTVIGTSAFYLLIRDKKLL